MRLRRPTSRETLAGMLRPTRRLPRPPVVIERVFDDPSLVRALVARGGPYWSVQRYLRNLTEMAALSDAARTEDGAMPPPEAPMFVAPWFRGDFAYDEPLVEGAGEVLHHPRFVEAARRLFPGASLSPQVVYVNLNPPMPQVDPGHTDVPCFRGVDRTRFPIWLLVMMLKSGLFDRWYVPMATAVAWFYEGPGGGFRYWPEGPDAPPVDRPCVTNSAVVGDNDVMFHCVHQVGPVGERVRMTKGLTLDATLRLVGDELRIEDGGKALASFPYEAVRISVSWKALVFESERARQLYEDHTDDLTAHEVRRIFMEDLARRGVAAEPPEDLLTDTRFMNVLNGAYHYAPTVFAPRA